MEESYIFGFEYTSNLDELGRVVIDRESDIVLQTILLDQKGCEGSSNGRAFA